jgi:nitrogen regulatory protein PII
MLFKTKSSCIPPWKNSNQPKSLLVGMSCAFGITAAPEMTRHALRRVMKRIELIIEPSTLDRFTEAARAMNLSDFDVTEVRRFPLNHRQERQRVYRGQTFVVDFEERLKVDINVANEAANRIANTLIARVEPESVVILVLDRATVVEDLSAPKVTPISREAAFAAH